MTIDEAKKAATNGAKITHRFFEPEEFIGINSNGEVYTEDLRYRPVPWEWFMECRQSLSRKIDWEIWRGDFKN